MNEDMLFYTNNISNLYHGDVRDVLKSLSSESVHCVVTSPPYWGLRDYQVEEQLGLEPTPEEYCASMVEVFREVRRVLSPTGTVWLNLGDSYHNYRSDGAFVKQTVAKTKQDLPTFAPHRGNHLEGLKSKDLMGMPWRVAFALQADGWYLRSDIIWSKPNPMPESVQDRPTKAHEYIFLLTKSPRYYYDADAIKEQSNQEFHNKRSVWEINTHPYPGAHFATYPEKLVEPCILAGTSEKGVCAKCSKPWERVVDKGNPVLNAWSNRGAAQYDSSINDMRPSGLETGSTLKHIVPITTLGWQPTCECSADTVPATVLDPFVGSGTTCAVSQRLGRHSIGIDASAEYLKLAKERIGRISMPMF